MGWFEPDKYFVGIRDDLKSKECARYFYALIKIIAGIIAVLSATSLVVSALVSLGWISNPIKPSSMTSTVRQLCPGFPKTVYSNATPAPSDIINLCDAGTLRPASGNIRLGGIDRGEKPYNNSIEILMVLNLISRDLGTQGALELQAIAEPKPEEYLLFLAGTEREIITSGRTFLVKLNEINIEPTTDGAPYFSYHFSVNEK